MSHLEVRFPMTRNYVLRWLGGGSYLDITFAFGVSKTAFSRDGSRGGIIWPTILCFRNNPCDYRAYSSARRRNAWTSPNGILGDTKANVMSKYGPPLQYNFVS